jgi:hypothetical protein
MAVLATVYDAKPAVRARRDRPARRRHGICRPVVSAERTAISEFCEAWFESALTTPSGPDATTVLPFAAVMHHDATHWLHVWSATPGQRADEQLAHLITWWLPDLLGGDLDISFSGDLPDVAQELTAWLLAETASRLRDGDLSAENAYVLSQLALPEAQRWR